jgi:hypothetical protein
MVKEPLSCDTNPYWILWNVDWWPSSSMGIWTMFWHVLTMAHMRGCLGNLCLPHTLIVKENTTLYILILIPFYLKEKHMYRSWIRSHYMSLAKPLSPSTSSSLKFRSCAWHAANFLHRRDARSSPSLVPCIAADGWAIVPAALFILIKVNREKSGANWYVSCSYIILHPIKDWFRN